MNYGILNPKRVPLSVLGLKIQPRFKAPDSVPIKRTNAGDGIGKHLLPH